MHRLSKANPCKPVYPCISAIYKNPVSKLETSDLQKQTTGCDQRITAGDVNSKHPVWHSQSTNQAQKSHI